MLMHPFPARPTLTLIQPPNVQDWERGEIERISALLRAADAHNDFEVIADPQKADLVVLLESCTFKTRHDLPFYDALPFTRNPWKLCCINYEDGPPGFLPGLYSSLESYRFDPTLHVSWPHLRFPNEWVDAQDLGAEPAADAMLFSFSGACSHALRRRLFSEVPSSARWRIREIRKWYNHEPGEKRAYVEEILGSRFVLCPRGLASYSHRIVETLALGRVPVIIADDWVPFTIPERGYYVRIAERDVARIPELLQAADASYQGIRARATEVHRRYFAPSTRYSAALNHLMRFFRERQPRFDHVSAARRWRSRKFWRSNSWALEQRVAQRLRRLGMRVGSVVGRRG
jgi:hypothetical protein